MKIIYLLHFYQPDFQFKPVLEDVYYNSYKRIFEAISESNKRVMFNITSSTIEMMNNYSIGNIIEDLKKLYQEDRVEFTSTALSHVLLSHSTEMQALRQVGQDIDKKAWYLNIPKEKFSVLFPPELSVNSQVLKIAKKNNLKGVLVANSSIKKFEENNNFLLKNNLKLFVRSLKLSRIFESKEITTLDQFKEAFKKEGLDENHTYIIAHDAEILGYQNQVKIALFKEILKDKSIEFTTFNEVDESEFNTYDYPIVQGTWEKMPIENMWIDPHWKNPKNKIHKYQWKLSELVVKEIEEFPEINKKLDLQTHLDYCQYSCQYWWASSYPFWSSGIISHAAWNWLYLSYKVYYEMLRFDKTHANAFIKKANAYYMNLIKNLNQYDITKWHEKNIRYYDDNILPLKLKFQL